MTQSVKSESDFSGNINVEVNQLKHKKMFYGCAIAAIVCFAVMLGFLQLDSSLCLKNHIFHHFLNNPSAVAVLPIFSALFCIAALVFSGRKKGTELQTEYKGNIEDLKKAKDKDIIKYFLRYSFDTENGIHEKLQSSTELNSDKLKELGLKGKEDLKPVERNGVKKFLFNSKLYKSSKWSQHVCFYFAIACVAIGILALVFYHMAHGSGYNFDPTVFGKVCPGFTDLLGAIALVNVVGYIGSGVMSFQDGKKSWKKKEKIDAGINIGIYGVFQVLVGVMFLGMFASIFGYNSPMILKLIEMGSTIIMLPYLLKPANGLKKYADFNKMWSQSEGSLQEKLEKDLYGAKTKEQLQEKINLWTFVIGPNLLEQLFIKIKEKVDFNETDGKKVQDARNERLRAEWIKLIIIGGLSVLALFMPLILRSVFHLNSVWQQTAFWSVSLIAQAFSLYYMYKKFHRLVPWEGDLSRNIEAATSDEMVTFVYDNILRSDQSKKLAS